MSGHWHNLRLVTWIHALRSLLFTDTDTGTALRHVTVTRSSTDEFCPVCLGNSACTPVGSVMGSGHPVALLRMTATQFAPLMIKLLQSTTDFGYHHQGFIWTISSFKVPKLIKWTNVFFQQVSNVSASNAEVKWNVMTIMKWRADRDSDWSGRHFTKLTIRLQTEISKIQKAGLILQQDVTMCQCKTCMAICDLNSKLQILSPLDCLRAQSEECNTFIVFQFIALKCKIL
jgi:hypothetical protein